MGGTHSTVVYAIVCVFVIGLTFNANHHVFETSFSSSGADFASQRRELHSVPEVKAKHDGDWFDNYAITPNINPNQEVDHRARKITMSDLDLEVAKQHALKFMDLVYNRYQLGTWDLGAYFYMTSNMADVSFDIYKYRLAKKIMEKDARYLMIYGGSSVTAGHDGQFNSSFCMIADKRMRPIFDALNIDLVTENIAQAANNCIPYGWCYEGMADADPDFVNWEQSYNCGHDGHSFELTARVAGNSKNRGVIWYSASGAFSPGHLPPSEFNPPYCEEEWTVESVQAPHEPLQHWYPDKDAVAAERKKLHDYHRNSSSTSRFIPDTYLKSVAPSGFNVWTASKPCPYGLTDKNGQHTYASDVCDASNFMNTKPEKTPRFFSHEAGRYDNPTGRGAGHHPTKAFHMWRGEAIAFMHVLAILDAIYMIEDDMKVAGNTRDKLFEKYDAELAKVQGPMPPAQCKNYYCPHKAECYTDYKPHPRGDHYLNELFVGHMNWTVVDPWKTVYHNKDVSTPIYLKVTAGATDLVVMCGQMQESLKHTIITFDLNGGESKTTDYSTYSFETRPASAPPLVVWAHRKYIGNECTELSFVPPGTHIIQIKRDESIESNHVNSLIDVITFS